MDFEEKNINFNSELNLVFEEQETVNEEHILKAEYLAFLLDQLLLEYIQKKDAKTNVLQSNNIAKTKYSKKPIFLYLLINFYIALVLLTFVFFFIIDPFKIIHN